MLEPPADVLAWVEARLAARVLGASRLGGGLDAHMFALSLEGHEGVVLRVARDAERDDISLQARMLRALADSEIPAPRFLAVDAEVGAAGCPVLLQTLLPGDTTLPAVPGDAWLLALVGAIVRLQELTSPSWFRDRASARWRDLAPGIVTDWTDPELTLVDALRARGDTIPFTKVFVHDDFWPGNTLRDGDGSTSVFAMAWRWPAGSCPISATRWTSAMRRFTPGTLAQYSWHVTIGHG